MAATIMPRRTRKTRIYTFPPTLSDMILNITSIAPSMLNPENIRAPINIPIARDIYTSLVASANMIVTTGGTRDQIVSAISYHPLH